MAGRWSGLTPGCHVVWYRELCGSQGLPYLYEIGRSCSGPVVSQSRCAPVPLCISPTVSLSCRVPALSVPLCLRPIVHQYYCVPVPLCHSPIAYQLICVRVPCPIVSLSHCVLVTLCPRPVVHQSRYIASPGIQAQVRARVRV